MNTLLSARTFTQAACLVLSTLVAGCSSEKAPEATVITAAHTPAQQEQAARQVNTAFRFAEAGEGFVAYNAGHALSAELGKDGLSVRTSSRETTPLSMRTVAFGREGQLNAAETGEAQLGACADTERRDLDGECLQRVELDHGDLTEWWVNRPDGLEHGFDIAASPPGQAALVVQLAVAGAQAVVGPDGQSLRFDRGALPALTYAGLLVNDAQGKRLSARMVASEGGIALRVDDRGAKYPVRIDPVLASAPDRNIQITGIGSVLAPAGDIWYRSHTLAGHGTDLLAGIPSTGEVRVISLEGSSYLTRTATKPAASTAYGTGRGVSAAGDFNCDGIQDWAISAPDPSVADTDSPGVVYVFRGSHAEAGSSATTWSTSNVITLRGGSDDDEYGAALAFADFGRDGCSDLVVGAPGGSSGRGYVHVLNGYNDGLNQNHSYYGTTVGARVGASLAVCDFDGLGGQGLAVGMPAYNSNSGGILYFENTGSDIDMTPDFTFTGGAGAKMGAALAAVGDIKGDGRCGLLVGAPGVGGTGQSALYLRVPSTQSGSTNWFISMQRTDGAAAGDQFGASVAAVGDLNGDGIGDWAVGAPGVDVGGQTDAGRVTTYFGSGTDIYASEVHSGTYANQRLGQAVAGAGDFNNDGFTDAAYGYSGGIQIYYGSPGDMSLKAFGTDTIANYLTVADVRPTESTDIGFGKSIDWASDVNADGYQDVLIGAPSAGSGAGRFYLRYGAAASPLSTGLIIDGTGTAGLGAQVVGLGDVTGDNKGDLAVTASGEGAVHIYYGDYTGWEYPSPFALTGMTGGAISVAAAGDVNGDGMRDMIVGWSGASTNAGRASVYHGRTNSLNLTAAWTVNGQTGAAMGQSVAGLGDINGDGYDDVAVGSPLHDTGTADVGQVAVYLGSATGLSTTPVFTASGSQANQRFGEFVARVGDVNGDGLADLGVGSPETFQNGATRGQAYVYLASGGSFNATPTEITGSAALPPANTKLGSFITGGDFNGDDISDVIVSSRANADSRHIYTGGPGGLVTDSANTSRYRTWHKGSETSATHAAMVAVGDVNGDFIPDFASAANGSAGVVDYVTVVSGRNRTARPATVHINPSLSGYQNSSQMSVVFRPPTQGANGRVRVGLGVEATPGGSPRSGYSPAGTRDNSTGRFFDPAGLVEPLYLTTYTLPDGARNRLRMRVVYSINETVTVPHSRWMYIGRDQEQLYATDACSSDRNNDLIGGTCNVCATDYYGFSCTTYCTRSATCANHGSCDSNGACGCDSGYAGSTCQYSDATTCNAHGTAQSNGSCVCSTGYVGAACQYSDALTCNSRGTAQSNGTCVCTTGSAGPHCEYTNTITCNAQGTAQNDGSCVCNTGIAGARCDVCGTNRYNYPSCTLCEASTTCNAHGSCSATGTCTCNSAFTGTDCSTCSAEHYNYPSCTLCNTTTCNGFSCNTNGSCNCPAGYAGAACQYTDSGTCSGRGTAQNNGSCVCSDPKYAGTRCESCATGLTGSACQYSNALTCSGHGTAQFDGSCVCSSGFAGTSCQFSDAVTCNAHGAAQTDGSCSCTAQFTGSSCSTCATNYFAYPSCTFCTASGTCNGNGTCSTSGSCSCASGAAGTSCEYTDAVTCNGRGTVDGSGACTCQALFTGTRCQNCIAGRAGSSCQYTDALTCSGQGVAQFDGSCVCASGFTGSACQFSASATCTNHGTVSNEGVCSCATAFTGTACDACAPDHYVYPGCTFCAASSTCNGNGSCTSTGGCSCASDAAGNRCQYTDASTCNSHGEAQTDGSCVCRAEFLGANCERCIAGRAGPDCQYTDVTTCNGHGVAQSNGACVCSGSWTGTSCQYSPETTCSTHGSVSFAGVCTCDSVHGGSACDQCATNRFNYPGCATFCQASTTCSGNGSCNNQGACVCDNATGTSCQFTRATTCRGHGDPDASGNCACDTGFTGVDCSSCAANYYGASCDYCVASSTCNGHGQCAAGGGCTCDAGYAGAACDSCAPDNYVYPSCIPCSADVTCRGRGTCQSNGTCDCDDASGFSGSECQYSNAASCSDHGFVSTSGTCQCSDNYKGTSCEACNDNYLNYPQCAYCVAAVTCHGHGSCDGVGACVCAQGYAGSDCNYSRAITCSGHGTPSDAGLCQCDTGFGGRQCQLSRQADCSNHGEPQEGGSCLCDAGYIGANCSIVQATACSGHGVASLASDGGVQCACAAGFSGVKCDSCAPDHYEYPTCRRCDAGTCNPARGKCLSTGGCECLWGGVGSACQYLSLETCRNGGKAQYDGTCLCDPGRAGVHCEYSNIGNCAGHGTVDGNGVCTCDVGYTGKRCATCDEDYYTQYTPRGDPICVYCDAETTCSAGGACTVFGTCSCSAGFAGDNCQYSDAKTCSGKGTAQSNGTCVCQGTYGGANCEKCASGYSGRDCAVYCDDQKTCGGRGNCSANYPTGPERCECFPRSYLDTSVGLTKDLYGTPWTCSVCPAGNRCEGFSKKPVLCGKGMYAPPGSYECKACPTDTYNDKEAAEACTPCTKPEGLPVCTAWACDPTSGKAIYSQSTACMFCDNGKCDKDKGETCDICAKDCGTCYTCGDAMCDAARGENCRNCAIDCETCPVKPSRPAASDSYPTFSPAGASSNMCTGTPRLGNQTPAQASLHGNNSTPSMFGTEMSTDIKGSVSWEHSYEDGLCQWKTTAGMEVEQCVAAICAGVETTYTEECEARPRCTDELGYTCQLPDKNQVDLCDMTLQARGNISRKVGWNRDFGPFFAEIELQGGVFLDLQQQSKHGTRYTCNAGSDAYAGQYGKLQLIVGFQAKATASLGIQVAGFRKSVSASAKACFGMTVDQEDRGCSDPRSTLKRGAELQVDFAGLDLGLTTLGAFTKSWKVENGCFK